MHITPPRLRLSTVHRPVRCSWPIVTTSPLRSGAQFIEVTMPPSKGNVWSKSTLVRSWLTRHNFTCLFVEPDANTSELMHTPSAFKLNFRIIKLYSKTNQWSSCPRAHCAVRQLVSFSSPTKSSTRHHHLPRQSTRRLAIRCSRWIRDGPCLRHVIRC